MSNLLSGGMTRNKIMNNCSQMIRQIIPAFLLLVSFFYQTEAVGQVPANVPEYLTEKLSSYCKAVPWEDLFIHTDRKEYIAGEDLWFNAYLNYRYHDTTNSGSKIAYIEILNPLNVPVVQKRIRINNGSGPGYINLPDSLATGRYKLIAFTNLMKNFFPENCFVKDLFIYNALKGKVLKEGPSFTGITEKINYQNPSSQGFVFKVNNSESDSLEILFSTDESYWVSNYNLVYLLIHTRGSINRLSQIKLTSKSGRIVIPKKDLMAGINHITFFNSAARPIGERYIYIPAPANQNITLNSPGTSGKRDRINLEIELSKELISSFESANLSIAVTPSTNKNDKPDLSDFMVFGTEFGILPSRIRDNKLSEIPVEAIDSLLLNFKSRWIDWSKILSGERPSLNYRPEKKYHFVSGRLVNQNSRIGDSFKYVIISTPGKQAAFQYAMTDSEGRFTFVVPIEEPVQDLIIQPLESKGNSVIQIESSFPERSQLPENILKSPELTVPLYIPEWSSNYQVGKIYGSSFFRPQEPDSAIMPVHKRFYGKPDIELVMDDYIKLPVMSEVFFELLPGVFLKSRKSVWEITIADPVINKIYNEPPIMLIDGIVIDDASMIANMDPELVEKIDVVKDRYLVGDFLFFGIVNVITRAGDFSNVTLPGHAVRLSYRISEPVNSFFYPDYSATENKQSRIPDLRNTLYWNPAVKPDKEGRATVEFWSSDVVGDYVIDIQGITGNGTKVSMKKLIKIR